MSHRSRRATAMAAFITMTLGLVGLYERDARAQGATEVQQPVGEDPPTGQADGGGEFQPPPPPTPQEAATVDLTGYWVSLVTEDWHWRMSVPEAGDVASIPFTNDEEKRAELEAWDPEQDEAGGNLCKAYGAAAIMRVPTRVHITWDDENTMKLETDAGTQTRLFRFDTVDDQESGESSLQGTSVAKWWQPPAGRGGRPGRGGRGRGGPPAPPSGGPSGGPATPDGALGGPGGLPVGPPGSRGGFGGPPPEPTAGGSMEVITTNLAPGYLRKNGVPYSDQTRVTEYFHRTEETYGNTYMIVTTIVEDAEYLTGPFITSSHFQKLPETDNGWNPTPCTVY